MFAGRIQQPNTGCQYRNFSEFQISVEFHHCPNILRFSAIYRFHLQFLQIILLHLEEKDLKYTGSVFFEFESLSLIF